MYSQMPSVGLSTASVSALSQAVPSGVASRIECLSPPQRVAKAASGPSEPFGEFVSIQPEVLIPSPDKIVWLDQADQHLLDKLLRTPLEYMDHPSLHAPRAEEALFGGVARLGRNSTYFRETQASGPGAVPQGGRLDHACEKLGFQRYNYARMRVGKILQRFRLADLPRQAIRELLGWMHRALIIRGWLAQSNIALVLAMTQRSRFGGLDRNEVLSAGNYALLRSIDRFDWSRGFKFSTYACQGITQRIMHVVEATRRYRSRFISDYDETLEPDDTSGRRHEIQAQSCVEDLREILVRNRANLTDIEQAVLKHRFGLQITSDNPDEERAMTLQEIGEVIGVTKERIRQIQMRALRKLRVLMEREYLAA